jgi:hypothetical protein
MRASPVVGVVVLCLAGGQAAADRASPSRPRDEVDVQAARKDMVVLHDGHGHYLALVPYGASELTFYGDGKDLYQLRVFGSYTAQGDGKSERRIWAPISGGNGADIELADGKWTVRCSNRRTSLVVLGEAETRKVLDRAVFRKPFWKRQAYALARDASGTYYYVDKLRDDRSYEEQTADPDPPTGYRLFVGRKGRLKPQKLTDTAPDSRGVVLSTRRGDLSIDLGAPRVAWSRGEKVVELTYLPPEDNATMIYRDLGLYRRLGIPCDDM